MNKLLVVVSTVMIWGHSIGQARATDYYVAPEGLGNGVGTYSSPFNKFTSAWNVMKPGDTLYLQDGTYLQTLEPTINGQSGRPITIRSLNDGKAIIDGENVRHTVVIGKSWDNISNANRDTANPYGNYINLEGIVAKNSGFDVYEIYARNVSLRRVSGYNANPHDNYHVVTVWSKGTPTNPANVLVEDSIAAGSGRKMMVAYDTYVNVVFRRNFAAWQSWLGDKWCHANWPQADGIEIYPKAYEDQPDVPNNSILENNILFGLTPNYGFSLNPNPGDSIGNSFFGDIAIGVGMRWDNIPRKFVLPSASTSSCNYNGTAMSNACSGNSCISFQNSNSYRAGFVMATHCSQINYLTKNNTLQDIFSYSNASVGLVSNACGEINNRTNNKLIRATIIGNGIDRNGLNVASQDLNSFSVTDSKIQGTNYNGGGAKIQNRYVDGVLTADSLWPWPMEERIKRELADPTLFQANGVQGEVWTNFSVTENVCQNILLPNGAVSSCSIENSIHIPGDTNGDLHVDIFDYNNLIADFGSGSVRSDFDTSGKVDIFDYNTLMSNFGY